MRSSNILDPIWLSYKTTQDCLKVARRSLERGDSRLIEKTVFVGDSIDSATSMIEECSENANDFVIVSLWAVFERKLIDYLKYAGRGASQSAPPSMFRQQVNKKIESNIEYWKTDEILDIFKAVVDDNALIGDAKNVKKRRDWIAHKNPQKKPSTDVTPQIAYSVLSSIIEKLDRFDSV